MKTRLGHYVIFDITAYLPGRKIPKEFCDEACRAGVWFFQPTEWSEENHWGGIASAWYRNFPMIYSPGHKTAEEALNVAQEWEDGEGQREQRTRQMQASLLGDYLKW